MTLRERAIQTKANYGKHLYEDLEGNVCYQLFLLFQKAYSREEISFQNHGDDIFIVVEDLTFQIIPTYDTENPLHLYLAHYCSHCSELLLSPKINNFMDLAHALEEIDCEEKKCLIPR